MTLLIDGERLRRDLEALGEIGRTDFGITRRAFTEEDRRARVMVSRLMEEAGLEVRIDPVGNVFGRLSGRERTLPIVMCGSHIDTVPSGGMFDGSLGVIAGIEALRAIKSTGRVLQRSVEVAAFANEEGAWGGGTFGSRAFIGALTAEEVYANTTDGQTVAAKMLAVGLEPDDLHAAKAPYPLEAYLELHVEQGAVLDKENLDIGIVTGIVSTCRWMITVRGDANHAGTTPMHMRDDALVKASKFIVAASEEASRNRGDMVATIGQAFIQPNAPNVIAGEVKMVLGMRSLSEDRLEVALSRLKETATNLGGVDIDTIIIKPPVMMNDRLVDTIERVTQDLQIPAKKMHSGAGHDAMCIARIAPVGMIFVPSKNGKSHVPEEYTEWRHVTRGAEVLAHTILRIAEE